MVLVLQFFRELRFIEASVCRRSVRAPDQVAVPSGTALH